jgi:hypothetical protein
VELQANFHAWIAFYKHVKTYDWFWKMLNDTVNEADEAVLQKLEASGKDVAADVAVAKPHLKCVCVCVWCAAYNLICRQSDSFNFCCSFHKLTTLSGMKSGPAAIGITETDWDTSFTMQQQSSIIWSYPEVVQVPSLCGARQPRAPRFTDMPAQEFVMKCIVGGTNFTASGTMLPSLMTLIRQRYGIVELVRHCRASVLRQAGGQQH